MSEIEKTSINDVSIFEDDTATDDSFKTPNSIKYLRSTTFKLEPEIIPRSSVTPRVSDISSLTERMKYETPTEAQLKEICEQNRRKVRRLVAAVCISLTVLCVVLVIVSLSFGPRLEELGVPQRDNLSPFERKTDFVTPFSKNISKNKNGRK